MNEAERALLERLAGASDPEAQQAVVVEALRARLSAELCDAFDAACVVGRFHPGLLAAVLDVSRDEGGRRFAALEALPMVRRLPDGGCRVSSGARRAVRSRLGAQAGSRLETWSRRACAFFSDGKTLDDRCQALFHAFWGNPAEVPDRLAALDAEVAWAEPPAALASILDELAAVAALRANAVGPDGAAIAAFAAGVAERTQQRLDPALRSLRAASGADAPPWLRDASLRLLRATPTGAEQRLAVLAAWARPHAERVARVLRALDYEVASLDLGPAADAASALADELGRRVRPGGQLILWLAGDGVSSFGAEGIGARLGDARDAAGPRTLDVAHLGSSLVELGARQILAVLDGAFSGPLPLWPLRESIDDRIEFREDYEYFLRTRACVALASHGAPGGDPAVFEQALCGGLEGQGSEHGVVTSATLLRHLLGALPPGVSATRSALDGRSGGDFVIATERAASLAAAPALARDHNPFLGLNPYECSDGYRFHGRDAETRRLMERVGAGPFTAVVGASGSGKSSLVQAGLLAGLPPSEYAAGRTIRPGGSPCANLLGALEDLADASSPLGEERLDAEGLGARARACLEAWLRREAPKRCVLVVDQFEELYTLTSEDERDLFLALLVAALEHDNLRLVITVRADFELLARHGPLDALWSSGRFPHVPMSRRQLHDVLVQNARSQAIHFEPAALVERIADDADVERGGMALMSFALSELYERLAGEASAPGGRVLRLEDYELQGGVRGALQTCAERLFASLDEAEQATMRRTLSRLVTVRGAEPTRRRTLERALEVDDDAETARTRRLLERLERARLVARRRGTHGERYVELAHEVLIVAWPRLWRWVHDDRNRELRERVSQAALEGAPWQDHKELDEVLRRVRRDPYLVSRDERRFLEEARGKRRRRRSLGGALALALVAGIGVGGVRCKALVDEKDDKTLAVERAWERVSQAEAKASEDRQLAALTTLMSRARTLRETAPLDPERAVLLSAYAVALHDSEATERALREALSTFPRRQRFDVDGFVDAISFSAASRYFATVVGRKVVVHDRAGGPVGPVRATKGDAAPSVAVSGDGSLVGTLAGGTLQISRLSGERVALPKIPHRILAFGFLPGNEVVTVDVDLVMVRWQIMPELVPRQERSLLQQFTSQCRLPGSDEGKVCWVSFGADSTVLALNIEGTGSVAVWRVAPQMEELLPILLEVRPEELKSHLAFGSFSADGTRLVVTDPYGVTVRALDGGRSSRFAGRSSVLAVVDAADTPPPAAFVVAAADGAQVKLWREGDTTRPSQYLQHVGDVGAAAFGPRGLLATAGEDAVVQVWDPSAKVARLLARVPYKAVKDYDLWFRTGMAWAPDGSALAVASRDGGHVDLWSLAPVELPSGGAELVAEACRRVALELDAREREELGLANVPDPCPRQIEPTRRDAPP
ncbi:MAG: hypothetical protein HY908_04515 [Myxococcales bacterium]|nr:hypothetical protein [Myxococcales bacterium]